MEIRLVRPSHLPAIQELDRHCGLTVWNTADYLLFTREGDVWFAVAEEEDSILGFCLLSLLHLEAEILKIAVHPQQQGKNVGQRLLDSGLEQCRVRGCVCCLLEVRSQNERALRFYYKNGFRVIGVRRAYYRDPVDDALQMRKLLYPERELHPSAG